MTGTTDTLHYLVIDHHGDRPILVFLGENPATSGGPAANPVHLELLPPAVRFGRPGRPALGRPVLGQARGSNTRFREFSSSEDLWEAGFLPVPYYRVCDGWDDYHMPWTLPSSEQTLGLGADESI